jgi:hypothetical protein
MPSTAETIAARIAQVLTDSGIVGARVFRDRKDAFAADEGDCILVEIEEDGAQHFAGAQQFGTFGSMDVCELSLSIVFLTRSEQWQTALDALRTQAHTAIFADQTLVETLPGLRRTTANWDAASADTPFGTITQRYSGKYQAQTNQL